MCWQNDTRLQAIDEMIDLVIAQVFGLVHGQHQHVDGADLFDQLRRKIRPIVPQMTVDDTGDFDETDQIPLTEFLAILARVPAMIPRMLNPSPRRSKGPRKSVGCPCSPSTAL